MKLYQYIPRITICIIVISLMASCSASSNGELKEGEKCNQINLLSNNQNDPDGNEIREVNLINKSDKKTTFTVRIKEQSENETNTRSETFTLAPGATVNIGCSGKWTKNILKGEEWFIDYEYEIIDAVEVK